jgi:hypothetical protein
MHRIRQRDVEGVDGGIGEQRFVAADAGTVIAAYQSGDEVAF